MFYLCDSITMASSVSYIIAITFFFILRKSITRSKARWQSEVKLEDLG